jgi:hypothetical protein
MKKPSRRAVVRTGVWAVPVATAAAAPTFARTTAPAVAIESIGSGSRQPGHSTHDGQTCYRAQMVVTFRNTTTSPQPVTLIDFTIGGKAVTGFPTGTQLMLQPGSNPESFVVTSSASSQRTATMTYQYHGNIVTKTVSFPDFDMSTRTPQDTDRRDPVSSCA